MDVTSREMRRDGITLFPDFYGNEEDGDGRGGGMSVQDKAGSSSSPLNPPTFRAAAAAAAAAAAFLQLDTVSQRRL